MPSTAHNIFFTSGEQRKKPEKDDFEWLHPTTKPAEIAAAKEAYTANYNFIDCIGIQLKDPKFSTSNSCMPFSVANQCTSFETYDVSTVNMLI